MIQQLRDHAVLSTFLLVGHWIYSFGRANRRVKNLENTLLKLYAKVTQFLLLNTTPRYVNMEVKLHAF